MVNRQVLVVFVLPVILSIIFGSAVYSDILQSSNRESNGLSISDSEKDGSSITSIEILGLFERYSLSEPVDIQVKIDDPSFECGDLYITIYSSGKNDPIAQGVYFEQCFTTASNVIPIGDRFSKVIGISGSYDIVAKMVSKQLKSIVDREVFTVK